MININKKIFFILLCLIASLPFYNSFFSFFEKFDLLSLRTYLRNVLLSLCYIIFAALLWKKWYTRFLSILLALFWVGNFLITITIYNIFNAPFNEELAITALSTSFNEIKGFFILYWYFAIVFVITSLFLLWCISRVSVIFSTKLLGIMSAIILLTFSYKVIESIAKGKLKEPNFSLLEKTLPYLSLGNYALLGRAYVDLSVLQASEYKPNYLLDEENTSINIYVLVIGESVRRDHVSLYGYERETMPNTEKQLDNLFIFQQAISAAPITTMALASALTIKPVDSDDYRLLSYNIINLANQAGYKTYWYSRQGSIGQYNTAITSIAKNSSVTEWIDTGFDDSLLPKLEDALNDSSSQKKLIILHTNGSHFFACDQYPESATFFKNGRSVSEDCYDNSIRYTDQLLANIFDKLTDKPASVMYFSDHGQIKRIKRGEIDYFHGSINPSKEAVEVPQFIWFSPKLDSQNKRVGSYSPPYSTSGNYSLIANWLGIKSIDGKVIQSPILDEFRSKNDRIIIMDTRANIFDYQNLPSDKNVH